MSRTAGCHLRASAHSNAAGNNHQAEIISKCVYFDTDCDAYGLRQQYFVCHRCDDTIALNLSSAAELKWRRDRKDLILVLDLKTQFIFPILLPLHSVKATSTLIPLFIKDWLS